MSRFWSPVVARLTPYVPGEQPKLADLIKLNTNENPYPPSPKALAAIQAEAGERLRLYPDPNAEELQRTIAARHGVRPAQVFVGNGSDEVLAMAFVALFKHAQPILFPDITYSFYPVYCRLYEIAHEEVPLDDALRIRVEDYARPNGGIIVANPNAPTGCLLAVPEIERLAVASPDSAVVIDEAYIEFGGESAIPLCARHPNLLVIRTLSKSHSLAGLRVGYAVGPAELVDGLQRVKNSFNSYPLDRLAIAGAAAAIEDETHTRATCAAVAATRERLARELGTLGFEVLPSAANFVFARHRTRDASELMTALRARSIIVRHFRQARIAQHLRISVGTEEQCARLIAALQEIL